MVQNHDLERNPNEFLNYKDGARNILATEWLLASGYGDPQVYASFTFGNDTAQSPPSNADGLITNTDCASGQWACVNRDPGILAMVGWHNHVGERTPPELLHRRRQRDRLQPRQPRLGRVQQRHRGQDDPGSDRDGARTVPRRHPWTTIRRQPVRYSHRRGRSPGRRRLRPHRPHLTQLIA